MVGGGGRGGKFGVIGREIVLGSGVNRVIDGVGHDDMGVGVLGGVNGGFGIVDGKGGWMFVGGLVVEKMGEKGEGVGLIEVGG